MASMKFSFFVISTSDRGDFPRIIMISLFKIKFIECLLLRWYKDQVSLSGICVWVGGVGWGRGVQGESGGGGELDELI